MTEETGRKIPSPGRLALGKLRRHRLAVVALYVLGFLYLTCLVFSDFVAPYHFDNERRDLSYHPPSKVHLVGEDGKLHWPFVYKTSFTFDENKLRIYTEDKAKRYPIRFCARGDKHKLLGLIPMRVRLLGVAEPARLYLIGADARGRDLLSRIIYGGRISLSIGLAGVLVSFSIGMLMGGVSGYFGGKVDNAIQRLCEMIMLIPGFYLMIALRSALPPELGSVKVYFMIVLIMSTTRMLRSLSSSVSGSG